LRKFKLNQNRTRLAGTLHKDQHRFLIISRSILLRTKNISENICRENQKKHFTLNNIFRELCRLWENVEKKIL